MPPGSEMTAAYGAFTNHGAAAIELTTFRSEQFGSVSLHATVTEDGVSKMSPQGAFILEPNGSMILEPGGLHLMLMKPESQLSEADQVDIEVVTEEGKIFRFKLPVETR